MRKTVLLPAFFVIIILLMSTLPGISEEMGKVSVVTNAKNPSSANLNFLKAYNGKYPFKIKLFSNSKFTNRLKKLIGNRYRMVKDTCQVEIPIVIENNLIIVKACQPHNCSSTNYIIVYDFQNNIMYSGIRNEGVVRTFSENGTKCQTIIDWKNNY